MGTLNKWRHAGLDAAAQAALAQGLRGWQLWSLLLGVAEQRAAARGNFKLSLVASAFGSQPAATLFRTR